MYKECSILPPLIDFDGWDKYSIFEDKIYKIFKEEIYIYDWYYKNKPIYLRKQPLYNGREESFYHIICKKQIINGKKEFQPTPERAQRILWCKSIVNNEPCKNCCCNGIGVWSETKIVNTKTKTQTVLYLKKYKYVIILEEQPSRWLFITSYYVDDLKKRKKLDKKYKEETKNALLNARRN